jgi:ABC-2 type transport system ATP-binding protein
VNLSNAIETSGLGKSFRSNAAVKGLNLAIPEGTVFAFLEPNGAGKNNDDQNPDEPHTAERGRSTGAGHQLTASRG